MVQGAQCSVVRLLEHRRLGIYRYTTTTTRTKLKHHAIDLNILKVLVRSRHFRKIDQTFTCKGDVRYDHGKLFIRNYANKTVDCYAVSDGVGKVRALWSLPSHPRWEDQTILADYKTPGYEQPSLVVVKADSNKSNL